MKWMFAFVSCLFLSACAGNPPTWWNPQNRYGTLQEPSQGTVQPVRVRKNSAITEQSTEPLADISYEEETISPLPQDDTLSVGQTEQPLPVPSVLE